MSDKRQFKISDEDLHRKSAVCHAYMSRNCVNITECCGGDLNVRIIGKCTEKKWILP